MIEELVESVSIAEKNSCGGTYERTVFPDPAASIRYYKQLKKQKT
jgi:hypothetical protein